MQPLPQGETHCFPLPRIAKEGAVLAVTRHVGARLDVLSDGRDDDALHVPAFTAEHISKCSDAIREMGDGGLTWQVGDQAWVCDSGDFAHILPSAAQMKSST